MEEINYGERAVQTNPGAPTQTANERQAYLDEVAAKNHDDLVAAQDEPDETPDEAPAVAPVVAPVVDPDALNSDGE